MSVTDADPGMVPMSHERRASDILADAVQNSKPLTRSGFQERLFTLAFRGLVYPQIWEDPEVDLAALQVGPGQRMAVIASGGCNALSYLTANPAQVIAVDLNPAHVALVRLKQVGFLHAPTYQAFYRFFGEADHPDNIRVYDEHFAPHLDVESRKYWEWLDILLRRRIRAFSQNIYKKGLLGTFIGAGHVSARALGVRLSDMLACKDLAEQRAFFDREIEPMFDAWVVRWATSFKASIFGLGIPPSQYDLLAREGGGDMSVVLKRRLRKLLCDFPLSENYFAWQALARRYAPGDAGPLPLYLQSERFGEIRHRVRRLSIENASLTDRLAEEPDRSLDGYVLLDAQDWMSDEQLNAIWAEITRTAAPNARVIFRTADTQDLLPGRLDQALLSRWSYQREASRDFSLRDRSAIYGAFHLYVRQS